MSLLFLKAKPELDLRYISNLIAFSFVTKAEYHTNLKGALVEEYFTSFLLCFANRFVKS